MSILFVGIILFFGLGEQYPARTKTDTVVIAAKYSVEFTQISLFHGSLAGFFGKVGQFLNLAPKELVYQETVVVSEKDSADFRMDLQDQTGREWFRIYSDTSELSFIDPPQFRMGHLRKTALKPDVIRFVADIRGFFQRGQESYFHSRFALWKDTVDFVAVRDSLHPLIYWFSCFNQRAEPLTRGTVLVSYQDGLVIYPWVNLYLYKNDTGMILETEELNIKK